MFTIFTKLMSRQFRSERRAAVFFIGGFAAAMITGQVLDERHCTFDNAQEKPMLNWLARLCSDIRVSSGELSANGAALNHLPRKGALEDVFKITD